jgi:peptide/nickel transport system permease protein
MKKAGIFIKKHKLFTVFFCLAVVILLAACFPSFFTSQDPYKAVMTEASAAPSAQHWFGTDKLGRDLYTRVIYGTRISLSTSFLLVGIVFVLGTALGILAGYFGGVADAVIMRISDMMMSFPGLVLAIAIAGIMGSSLVNAVFAIAAVTWPKYARLSRSLVLKIKNRDFVAAARLDGSGTFHILWKYMLQISLPIILVTAASDIGKMMLEMAALSFLGFGAQPPEPEWGLMMNEARTYLQAAPWMMIFPGIAMFITVAVFNMLGDCLRDILTPEEG